CARRDYGSPFDYW
nr:immunoglobulin heavy chain junction region [Mus musculus]